MPRGSSSTSPVGSPLSSTLDAEAYDDVCAPDFKKRGGVGYLEIRRGFPTRAFRRRPPSPLLEMHMVVSEWTWTGGAMEGEERRA